MRPSIQLDDACVADNARAWKNFAGVALRAVVKAQGYGWGLKRLAGALEDTADAYCVADAEECLALRAFTRKPIVVLGSLDTSDLEAVLDCGALPNVAGIDELDCAVRWSQRRGRPLAVRVGILCAAGWSGLSRQRFAALVPRLANAQVATELWTHITDLGDATRTVRDFEDAVVQARDAGVRVVGTDVASTFALAAQGPHGTSVRVGIGLFGATGGPAVPGVSCALRVCAPIERRDRYPAGTRVGYGATALKEAGDVVTARCGYADGLAHSLGGREGVLAVGMQYVSALASRFDDKSGVVLLDGDSSLDAFARAARRLPHEIVTSFGNAVRARNVER